MKLCSKCSERGEFSPNKKAKDGLSSWCKKCCAQTTRERRAKDPKRAKEIWYTWYHSDIEKRRARDRAKYQNPTRKRKVYEYNRDRRRKNPEAFRAYLRIWRSHNRDRIRASNMRWKIKDLSAARYSASTAMKRWRARNPEQVATQNALRKARILAAVGSFSSKDVRVCFELQGGRCFYCVAPLVGRYHIDHMTPLARGGSNGPENIVCACPPCNLKKGVKTVAEFILVDDHG